MVEEVSPIIYKQINVSHFAKNGIESETQEQTLFYDDTSKKLIQIGATSIKIFNKNATNLKKDVHLQLNKGKIYKIAVDKKNKFMIVFLEKNEELVLLIINVQLEAVIDILHGDFNKLLGMFFIFNMQAFVADENEDTYFTLVFTNHIRYLKIAKNSQQSNVLESIEFVAEVQYSSSEPISTFIYNRKYMILCIKREKDESFYDFYNLSSPKFFTKKYIFFLKNKKNIRTEGMKKGMFQSIFSFFNPNSSLTQYEYPIINHKQNYKVNHFFLESIYNKLYFIFLNYDEGYIQFYHIKKLDEITKVYDIQFENEHINTLQFIDNLILIHNFDKSETTVLDLQSNSEDKVIYKSFPVSSFEILQKNKTLSKKAITVSISESPVYKNENDFNYGININYNFIETESMIAFTNTIFYTKNIQVLGDIIKETQINDILYYIYFDPMIYYDNASSKYEALLNLTRRKNSKEVIMHGLYELVKSNKNVRLIKEIFASIANQTVENKLMNNINISGVTLTKEKQIRSLSLINHLEEFLESNELPIPFQDIFIKKKSLVVQSDIYYKLFKQIQFKKNLSYDNIILLLVFLYQELKTKKIKVHSAFNNTLVCFLKKLTLLNKEETIFQFKAVPDSIELAEFLINDIYFNEYKYFSQEERNKARQKGLDILKRLKQYEKIFEVLVRDEQFTEAVLFASKNNIKYNLLSEDLMVKFRKLSYENLDVIDNYLNEIANNTYYYSDNKEINI